VAAARLTYGERWQSALSATSGLSQSLLSLIAAGERELTPGSQEAIIKAIREDIALQEKKSARALELLAGVR
jgi:hypothetical protein